ncbi:MAG: Mu transposase C-terminal domain-containing protein [Thermoplasmata archaeon]
MTSCDPRPLSSLLEDERTLAFQRYAVLRPHLEDGLPFAHVASTAGIPLRTAKRWLSRFRETGISGLARSPRSDRGQRRSSAELVTIVEGLALRRPRPSVAQVHRQAGEIARARGWEALSYSSVYAVVTALDPGLRTLAHAGVKGYRERYDLLHRHDAGAPNAMWQADHTPLDIWVRTPAGDAAKPWLTAIADDHSRAVAGYTVHFEAPSAVQTALALRQAIWRKPDPGWRVCGIPSTFYTDHGSDFISRHMGQVAADLHMQLVFSEPGMPRGRGKIERFFSTVNAMCLAALPGYAPSGEQPRPRPAPTALLSLAELDRAIHAFVISYLARLHSETGEPPQQRWEAGAFIPRMPDSLEQLDLLLLTVARPRKVRPDGIRFQGLRYFDLGLSAHVGETVTIRYDPRDVSELRVFHGGRFLCRVVSAELAASTISLKEVIAARTSRRRELMADLASRRSVVDQLLAARAWVPSIESAPVSPKEAPALSLYREP